MATPQELAEGLKERMQTISGLRCFDTMHPSPPPPAACVLGPTENTTYDLSFDSDGEPGLWSPQFEIEIFANAADPGRAQQALRAYVSPRGDKSIPAALNRDTTLGGRAQFTRVVRISGRPVLVDTAGVLLLRTSLAVEVTAEAT